MSETKPLLVQFGAGNIGRSLVGQLFSVAGWRVAFVDVADVVVDALNANGRYTVEIKDDIREGEKARIEVDNVSGIRMADTGAVLDALAAADLAGTSVGAANLPAVCALLAKAVVKRDRPLSVMLCENLHDAAKLARQHLLDALGRDAPKAASVGFVEAAISKMVPATPPEVRRADPLAVWAEAYNTLYLDRDAYLGSPPAINGVAWRGPFQAYVDRKLLLHNFPHATAAYHGCLRGKGFIWECMEDEATAREVRGCMTEVSRALAVRHGGVFTYDENKAWSDDLLRRFRNRALADPVFRVGRDLRRKLAPADRCIGALRLLLETGGDYTHTARAVAAALLFAPGAADPSPLAGDGDIVRLAAERGPEAVLTDICGLNPDVDAAPLARIADEYRALSKNVIR